MGGDGRRFRPPPRRDLLPRPRQALRAAACRVPRRALRRLQFLRECLAGAGRQGRPARAEPAAGLAPLPRRSLRIRVGGLVLAVEADRPTGPSTRRPRSFPSRASGRRHPPSLHGGAAAAARAGGDALRFRRGVARGTREGRPPLTASGSEAAGRRSTRSCRSTRACARGGSTSTPRRAVRTSRSTTPWTSCSSSTASPRGCGRGARLRRRLEGPHAALLRPLRGRQVHDGAAVEAPRARGTAPLGHRVVLRPVRGACGPPAPPGTATAASRRRRALASVRSSSCATARRPASPRSAPRRPPRASSRGASLPPGTPKGWKALSTPVPTPRRRCRPSTSRSGRSLDGRGGASRGRVVGRLEPEKKKGPRLTTKPRHQAVFRILSGCLFRMCRRAVSHDDAFILHQSAAAGERRVLVTSVRSYGSAILRLSAPMSASRR